MKKKTVIIHPHIKATLSNLNLDLQSELNRYEQYLNSASNYFHTNNNNSQSAIATLEKSVATLQQSAETTIEEEKVSLPPLQYQPIITEPEEEIDSIPVASRIINRQKSLLDTLLTPWGIFGLILFFGANALVFIGRDLYQESTANISLVDKSQDKQIETDSSQLTTPATVNNFSSPQTEETGQIISTNIPADTQINFPVVKAKPPSPPIPLANIENKGIIHRDIAIPYANFKTALLTEAETYYKIQLPPPPPITPLQSAVKSTMTTPLVNKPSIVRNNNNNQSYTSQNTLSPAQTVTANLLKPVDQTNVKYYIVTKYKNMDNYAQIKSIIPEALISNIEEEIVIQLGAFNDQSSAQQYNQKIKGKGISTNLITVSE